MDILLPGTVDENIKPSIEHNDEPWTVARQDLNISPISDDSERGHSKLKGVQQDILNSWWEFRPPSPVLYKPVKGTPFYDIFVERFVDDFAPDNHLNCGTSDALRAAGEVRVFSPLLRDAFQAASTVYFGQCVGDRRAVIAGQIIYDRVLKHMQQAIVHPKQSRSEGLLAAVCVVMALEVSAAIVARKPTFLAKEDWKTIPWSADGNSKDLMEALLEHVVDLPGILYLSDQLALGKIEEREVLNERAVLWKSIADLEIRLRQWKIDWVDNYPSGPTLAIEFQSHEHFPVFQYRDLITGEIITPPPLVYPDPQLTRVVCFYYAVMILLGSVDSRPENRIQKYELFAYAGLICRSMKYYMNAAPGNMINRMVFPITVAHAALPAGGVERAFVQEISRIIEMRKRLSSWSPLLEETKVAFQNKGTRL